MDKKSWIGIILGLVFIFGSVSVMALIQNNSNECSDKITCTDGYCDLSPTWYGGHNVCKTISNQPQCGSNSATKSNGEICEHNYDCTAYCVQGYCSIYPDKLNCVIK